MLLYISLHFAPVQTWLAQRVASSFSDKLNTKVTIKHIDFAFFNKMELKGMMVEDRKKDTLLYAGTVSVNITDWFFFKDKATLKYVGLKDAVVNMNRTDSVWNYQFLIDYFSGPKKETTKQQGGIEFDVKVLKLENIRFNQVDKWFGQDMVIAMNKLDLEAENIDIRNKKVAINFLEINQPYFAQSDYTGNRDRLNIPKRKRAKTDSISQYKWNNEGWIVDVKNIKLTDGVFNNEKESDHQTPTPNLFDGDHIIFANITGDLKNVHFEKDTLTTDINLSTKERSGFEVKKLQAAFKLTPQMMEFNKLDLVTNKSKLGDYYAMRYDQFNDMSSFLHKVDLEGNFINSELSSDDLAFFAPELKNWKRNFHIKGRAKGTIDNFSAKNMIIKSGNTQIDGDITLSGLPDINNTFIDFTSRNLETTYAELISIIPSLVSVTQPQLSKLGNIQYKGNYIGFMNDFVAYGTIKSSLGTVTGDLNMKFPEGQAPVYSGKVSTPGFQLGQFIDNNEFGNIAFDGTVKGSGFSTDNVKANLDGKVSSIDFGNYTYHNISVKGDFGKKIFNGFASIDDPNLKLENLQGTIDLSQKIPQINFDVYVEKADLKNLRFTKGSFDITGHFNLNFSGNNIDNFLGRASISNASLKHNGTPLSFDSLTLRSEIIDNKKQLTLQSNEVDASITGDFSILELPNAFQLFLNNYYPAYIKKPRAVVKKEDFVFSIHTKNVDEYVKLLDPRLQGFDNATFDGNLKLQQNELNINADVPRFSYDGKTFNNIRLHGKGNFDTLVTKIDVDDIILGDSLRLPATNISISSHDDLSDVIINTRASKTLNDASLHAQVQTLTDGVKINFSPSTFIINDKQWQIEKDGELTLTNSQVSANDIRLTQGNQQITIGTDLNEFNSTVINLKNVNIDDFTPFLFKDPHLEGIVSGNVNITNPFGKPLIEYDIIAEKFKFENDSIGSVTATGNYSTKTGIATFKAIANDSAFKFNIDGTFNANDTLNNQANINIKTERFDLKLLNNYLDGIFSDINGIANTSDLKITGSSKHLSLTGSATINDASLMVKYTQCKYKFSNETIIFNPDEIDFGNIELKDTLNNTATLSGKMYHRFFQNFLFDEVRFDTRKMLVLNTVKKDNPQFYGKVIGRATMELNGPVTNMLMTINGEPSRTDSSQLYLNTSSTSIENKTIDYINFIQFGKEMQSNYKGSAGINILVDMTVRANPACKVDVILDEVTGDIIKGQGNGELNIRVGSKEDLSIRGRYDITEGKYTFNFQALLKKAFILRDGSISWNGDPYKAIIDMTAEYLAKEVDFSGISQDSTRKEDIKVVAHLTETLLKPKIDFQFELLPNSILKNNIVLTRRLAEFKNDENEMNKQVTSLLLFNTFITNNQSFLSTSTGLNVAASTIGGMVSSLLSSSINKLLQSLKLNNVAFNFDLNPNLNLQNSIARLQGAAKVGVTFTFLNNRLIVNVGGNFDYNNPYVITTKPNNILVTPDLTVEWLLTEDGRVSVVGFNQTTPDVIGERNKTGVKLTYRKDVDRLSDLFKSTQTRRNQNQRQVESTP
ncbi:MAG: translocation/assembly module TamB domain-containing protein [Bacteroidota bacterium]